MINIPRQYQGIRNVLLLSLMLHTSDILAQDLSADTPSQIEMTHAADNPYQVERNGNSGSLIYGDQVITFSHDGIIVHGNNRYQLVRNNRKQTPLRIKKLERNTEEGECEITLSLKHMPISITKFITQGALDTMVGGMSAGDYEVLIGNGEAKLKKNTNK